MPGSASGWVVVGEDFDASLPEGVLYTAHKRASPVRNYKSEKALWFSALLTQSGIEMELMRV